MVYLLKMVIFHGYVSHNQMVIIRTPKKIEVGKILVKPSRNSVEDLVGE